MPDVFHTKMIGAVGHKRSSFGRNVSVHLRLSTFPPESKITIASQYANLSDIWLVIIAIEPMNVSTLLFSVNFNVGL